MTSVEEKELLCSEQNLNRSKKFMVTKKIANFEKTYFYIDEVNKLWCLPKISFWTSDFKKEKTLFYSYSDIVSFELQADGKVITSSTSGGLGSAVVGGVLFGGVGAIVGSNTGKKRTNSTIYNTYTINITINSMQNPNITFEVPNKKIANEIISALQLMYNSQIQDAETNTKNINIDNNNSVADEIKKYKELLDMGAITQAEFDIKKKQLLGINSNDTKSEYISNNEIKQLKIKCKVCGKEIDYNENETCNECDKIIKERLQRKKEEILVENTSTKILSNNEEKNEETELVNLKNQKNDEPVTEVDNKDNITNKKNISTFKKIINGLRHFLAILCLLVFFDDIKHIGYLLLAISISPYLYTFIKKINPQISNKVLKRIAIFLPMIVFLIVSIFIETYYFKKEKIELTVGESYTIEFNTVPENYELICTNTDIMSIENNILHANNVGNATVQLQIENKIVDTLDVTIKNIQAPEISENKNNQNSSNSDISYLKKYKNLKKFNNEAAARNFVNVLNQLNMDVSKVKHLSKLDDWANGDLFSFDYELQTYCIYFYENYEIKAITKGLNKEDIYQNENANFTDEEASNSTIILQYGQIGEYGKYDKYDGENYIRYYIPEGTYEIKALARNSIVYIEGKKIYKNSFGNDESEDIKTITLNSANDKQTISIKSNECIFITMGTSVSLTKI